ncbi:MAG: alpha amylase [Prevotella sp.]|nr:alpha amylase [Prevotella sp.]
MRAHILKIASRLTSTLLLTGAVVFMLFSCSSIDCPVQNTVSTQYLICDADGNETSLVDTIWVFTEREDTSDTLLLNRLTGKSAFSLPISYSHPEDVLIFIKADTTGNYALDTLWLKKDDIPHFESVDCAAHFFHRLTAVRYSRNGIDSVSIVNPNVDYDQSRTHLHIIFKPVE